MTDTQLKPCPFCGGKAATQYTEWDCVECENCAARTSVCDSEPEAFEAWNTRANEPTLPPRSGTIETAEEWATCTCTSMGFCPMHMPRDAVTGRELAPSTLTDAERAVVEAAVALVGEDIDAKRYWRLKDSLRAAVEALQKERER